MQVVHICLEDRRWVFISTSAFALLFIVHSDFSFTPIFPFDDWYFRGHLSLDGPWRREWPTAAVGSFFRAVTAAAGRWTLLCVGSGDEAIAMKQRLVLSERSSIELENIYFSCVEDIPTTSETDKMDPLTGTWRKYFTFYLYTNCRLRKKEI